MKHGFHFNQQDKYAVNLKMCLHLLILFFYLPDTTQFSTFGFISSATPLTLFFQWLPIVLQLLNTRDT